MLTAIAHQLRPETDAAHEQAEALIALATEQGFELFLAIGGILRAATLTVPGQRGEQIGQVRQYLAAQRETGSAVWEPYFLGLLADAYAEDGQVEAGLATLDEALASAQATGQRLGEAELYRLRGELAPAPAGDIADGGGDRVTAGLGRGPPTGGKIAGVAGRHESDSPLGPAGETEGGARPAGRGLRGVHRGL
jgi:predicted ATPase